jgi:gamma-glutamylputrescine oxidase
MSSTSDSHESYSESGWKISPAWHFERQESFPALTADLEVETAVVGGGVAGLAVAMSCAARNSNIAVFEAGLIGEGSSAWSAGILSSTTTVDLRIVEADFGKDQAARIARTVQEKLEECAVRFSDADWQSGSSYYVAAKPKHRSIIDSEVHTRRDYDFPVAALDDAQLRTALRNFACGIVAPGEHAVNPAKLLASMAAEAARHGARIFERTKVTSWKRIPGGFELTTASHKVRARNLVVAAGLKGAQLRDSADLNKLLVPVTGHILVTEPSPVVAQMVQQGGPIALWDTLKLYHYVRYLSDGRILVGGEEWAGDRQAKTLPASDPAILRLHAWAQAHHSISIPAVQSAWRATLIVPADGMPFVHEESGDGNFVCVITDGLPFGLALGDSIAARLTGGDDWLMRTFCDCRRLPSAVRMLKLLPNIPGLHALAHRIAFAALRVYDALA